MDWYCKGCNFRVYGSKKYCNKCFLDRSGNVVPVSRRDWKCKGCGFLLFASKNKCFKCGLDRYGNKVETINTSALSGYVGNNTRQADWNCPGCGFLIFGSKKKCFKCDMDRDGNALNKKGNIIKDDDDSLTDDQTCIICLTQPRNTIFLHEGKGDAHQLCCYACASQVFKGNKKCPMCRQNIQQIIKVYS